MRRIVAVRDRSIGDRLVRILDTVTFRDRLIGTLRLLRPVLEEPGVLVVGSEVPNLLEPEAASTLVVSQDVDVVVARSLSAESGHTICSSLTLLSLMEAR